MKSLYALCLVTLAVVLLDIILLHSRSVRAQQSSQIRIDAVPVNFGTVMAPMRGAWSASAV
jgi:hypothetical protein